MRNYTRKQVSLQCLLDAEVASNFHLAHSGSDGFLRVVIDSDIEQRSGLGSSSESHRICI